jgi:CheY-like chemotaxis protein
VKEALTNAAEHGNPTEVGFRVRLSEDRMQVSIVDDGGGFDLSGCAKGNGLLNLRNRLENLGGRCEITSFRDAGTNRLPRASATCSQQPDHDHRSHRRGQCGNAKNVSALDQRFTGLSLRAGLCHRRRGDWRRSRNSSRTWFLMDIHLPGESGIACTARLKQTLPALQVIMVTVYRNQELIFQALQAGACGYLLKRTSPEEAVECESLKCVPAERR